MDRDENMIAALKRERAVYVSRGDDDRVRQVDEQLKHYGYEGEQDAVPGPEVPQGRTATAGQQSAEGAPAGSSGSATEKTASGTGSGPATGKASGGKSSGPATEKTAASGGGGKKAS
jgi:hypothetical protein